MSPVPSSAPGATGSAPALRLAALAALALWALWTWAGAQGVWANDLAALWFAGHFAATGQEALIYAAPPEFFGGTPTEWEPLRASLGAAPQELAFPYVYPPLWAGLIAPLTEHLGPRAFFDAALALQIAMLAASVPLAAQIARPPRLAAPLFTLWGIAVLALTTASTAAVVLNQRRCCANPGGFML
ncbi:MAG: hypothetical protein AB7U46_09165 [Paenirhodobacter sp.]|uniref:hypothetical protein n=1 Tax=Paenirhodobacter sp. TaxID=1965326 RepID=UPI003D10A07D